MTQTSHSAPATPSPGTYRLDAEATSITFATRHIFGLAGVTGTFAVDSGEVTVSDIPEESRAVVTVAASSFATGTPKRDEKVRSAQFLDAVAQPTFSFRSTGLAQRDGHFVVTGDLTVKGTTAPIDLTVDRVSGIDGGLQATASARIDRYAFGVTAMKGLAGRYIDVVLDVRAHTA
jgi:polyisoprenoid-binding protein YceI